MSLLIILLAAALPPQYCEEVRYILDESVNNELITKEEARKIYDNCVNSTG